MGAGSARRLSHVTESSWGVPSGVAFQIDRFLAGANLDIARSSLLSQEMRSDRAVTTPRLGPREIALTLPFELTFETFDDFIASAMCAAWVAAQTANTGVSTTVVAGTTNTMAGTGIGTNIAVGDWVKVSGFTGSYVANNGYFKVTARTADLLTFAEAVNAAGTSALAACTSQSGISTQAMGSVRTGSTIQSLAIEEAYTDIGVYFEALGAMVNKMSLSIKPKSIITGAFDLLARSVNGPAATTYTGSTVAASTTLAMSSNDTANVLRVNGVPVAVVTGVDFNLDNGMEALWPVFVDAPNSIGLGRSNLTGTLSVFFTNADYYNRYLNETLLAIGLCLFDPSAGGGYAIDVPAIKLTANPGKDIAENNVILNIPFQVVADATTGLVNWKVSKLK